MTKEIKRKYLNILGVKIFSTSKEGVIREIVSFINNDKKFFVVTPNPEQLIMAYEDELYRDILNSADISFPDGIGIVAAAKYFSLPRPKHFLKRVFVSFVQGLGVAFSILFDNNWLQSEAKLIKGREVFVELIKYSNKKGWKVILLGDRNLSAQKAAKRLKENYIQLKVLGLTGPNLKNNAEPETKEDKEIENKVISKINQEKPDILFIGFRAPVQEKWLYRWYKELNFKCAMVVGGTFDYISGKKPLPPKWIEDINLEWFWRLLKGDQKIKRIIKAFPEFALRVYWEKLVKNSDD